MHVGSDAPEPRSRKCRSEELAHSRYNKGVGLMLEGIARACRPTARKIAACVCVLWATLGYAEAQSKAQVSALRSACRGDYMAGCSGVNPNGPGAMACLKRNARSPGCRAALAALGSPSAGAKAKAGGAKAGEAKSAGAKSAGAKSAARPAPPSGGQAGTRGVRKVLFVPLAGAIS